MILSSLDKTSPFTSGTTNFLVGSIRHADELSTTVIPASAYWGAYSVEVPPPAENKATSHCSVIASAGVTILYYFPFGPITLPLLRSDATGINCVTWKLPSAKTVKLSAPTRHVAPTTATFILKFV